MLRCVCSVSWIFLLAVQISRGDEDERKCYRGPEVSTKLSDWISRSLHSCRQAGEKCPVEKFHDIDLTRLEAGDGRTWYLSSSSGWSLSNPVFPRAEAYQGAFYYEEAAGETGVRRGVYLYPDWSSCVSGSWRDHILEEGGYCTITQLCLHNNNLASITTEPSHEMKLTYSPPSYSSFGLPPTMMDPFENRTVEVRPSHIPGSNEGLFTTRALAKGELVSFYSGFLTHCNYIVSPLHRRKLERREVMKIKMYTLQFFNETHGVGLPQKSVWYDLCVDIPQEFGPLARYRATLGHKANHSFRYNAQYSLFSTHPVLGTIMAVVATRDLPAGTEVLCKYGYPSHVYTAINITASDKQCFKGLCYDVGDGFENEKTSRESDHAGLASQLFMPGVTLH